MASRTVALDAESYELLRRDKRGGESFSDVVRRRLRPSTRISDLGGSLAGEPPETWEEIHRARKDARRLDERRRRAAERGRSR